MSRPLASIVMRSMNDIKFIEKTLEGLFSQSFKDFELLNIDSGSSDGTYEIIKKYNSNKCRQIRPQDYVPGKVLNSMVKECAGELIVFNNSDCIPMNSDWLKNLLEPLVSEADVGACFANQLPRPDADLLVAKDNLRAYGDGRISATWRHFFSLASSAARKKVLEEHPFDEKIQYSEDVEWSLRIKNLGWKIRYVPSAVVEHSHNYSRKELKKRFYNEGLADGRIFGERPKFLRSFLLPLLAESARDAAYLAKTGNVLSIPDGIIYRFIQRHSAYRGRRDFFLK